MNEVKIIHLGRDTFTIAIDAHKALQDYLHAIEKQVGKDSDVVKEVELRMAELLHERGITEDKVVLPDDVKFLKEQLGQPHEFQDDHQPVPVNDIAADEEGSKRLYRDTENGMIAGVCSGLGAYFKIDPLLFRLLFVVLIFSGGVGVLAYVLLWILVPEATTTSEKLQMQGRAVTLESLKATVGRTARRADLPGATKRAGNVLHRIFRLIGEILRYALVVILTAIALVLFVGTVVLGTYTLIHGVTIGGRVFFPVGAEAVWGVVNAMVALGVLALLLLAAAMSTLKRKWTLPGWVTATMIGTFFAAASVGTAIGFDIAPQLRGSYLSLQKTQVVAAQPFTAALLEGKATTFRYEPDSNYRLEFKYFGEKPLTGVTQKVENGQLTVDTTEYKDQLQDCLFCVNPGGLEVIIHAPSLAGVQIGGDEDTVFKSAKPFTLPTMNLTTDTHVTTILNNVKIGKVTLDASDSKGAGGRLMLTLSNIAGSGFAADSLSIYSGGQVFVDRSDELDVQTGERVCQEGAPFVYNNTDGESAPVTLNGRKIMSTEELVSLQGVAPSAYNCLAVY
jgi:phage shock protein PspC (stress-responsive transcriptional regulator)